MLLSNRGEPVDGVTVRIYVPVSMHREAGAHARGNLIGQMAVPLPIGIADPGARLRAISRETAQRKIRIRPSLGRMPHGIARRILLPLVKRQRVNVASTDIPGPERPLFTPESNEKVCRAPACSSTVCSRTKTVMGAAGPGRELTSIRSAENKRSTRWPR